jgi:hypothetical protein
MSENRPWYREPETFVAVAALIVSLSALGVGVYEARLQREHDRAEVWPNLELGTFTSGAGASVVVDNTGLGPAVVEAIVVTVDDKPVHNWHGVLQSLLGDSTRAYSYSSLFEHGVRPGDRVQLFGLPPTSMPTPFWQQIGRLKIRICYRSVFNEYWMLDARLGSPNRRTGTDKCAPQAVEDHF